MPLLRQPHGHHRGIRARLAAQTPADGGLAQDRHLMRRRPHCKDADPIGWLAAGIDLARAMLPPRIRRPPTVAPPSRPGPLPGAVSARPTALPSALGPIPGIRANPKSP